MTSRAPSTPLLFEIAHEIRAVGQIWRIEKTENGILFRFEVGTQQGRVFVPAPTRSDTAPPAESNSSVHTVSSLTMLRAWLRGFSLLSTSANKKG